MNMMSHHCDPHLRKQEEFGVPGNTVRLGKHIYVGCIVIGAPPHSNCHMYRENIAKHEKAYRRKIVNSGEYGSRDNTIKRLGFDFKDQKKEKIQKCQEKEDKYLKHLAFKWSLGEPSPEKKESDRKSREEGEKYAAKMIVTAKDENKNKQIKKLKQIKKIKNVQVDQKQSDKSQFKTHEHEVGCKQCNKESVHMCKEDAENMMWTKRGGWPYRGGLRGGAPAGRSSNVSTYKDLV